MPPGRRGNSPVEVASRHAPSCHNNLPASPSLWGRRRSSRARHGCRTARALALSRVRWERASPFAVPDRAPPHRRGAGPSPLRRQETVAGTRRDATTSATMPAVAGVRHLASHAVVDAAPRANRRLPPPGLCGESAGIVARRHIGRRRTDYSLPRGVLHAPIAVAAPAATRPHRSRCAGAGKDKVTFLTPSYPMALSWRVLPKHAHLGFPRAVLADPKHA